MDDDMQRDKRASSTATEGIPSVAAELNEPVLADDYPIYGGYWYVADGRPVNSDWHGITAREFKRRECVKELRRCDIVGRQRAAKADGKS